MTDLIDNVMISVINMALQLTIQFLIPIIRGMVKNRGPMNSITTLVFSNYVSFYVIQFHKYNKNCVDLPFYLIYICVLYTDI